MQGDWKFLGCRNFLREFLKFFSGSLDVFCEIDNLDFDSLKSTLSVNLKATKTTLLVEDNIDFCENSPNLHYQRNITIYRISGM